MKLKFQKLKRTEICQLMSLKFQKLNALKLARRIIPCSGGEQSALAGSETRALKAKRIKVCKLNCPARTGQ
jgi:hypothetical protein